MAEIFDSKIFNGEVFGKYTERIPRVKQNKLLEAGVLKENNGYKSMLSAQSGGNYIVVPFKGLIDGEADNYDGETDITADSTKTYSQGMIVVGRAKSWTEKDFSEDITSENFMDNIASQVSAYFEDLDQATLLSILKGIFAMGANDFTMLHTLDITSDPVPVVGATSLNTVIQRACGDNKKIFTVAVMHSSVSTNLENLQVLKYLTYTDSKGIERELEIASWNGRLVFVDDSVPTSKEITDAGKAGVYTFTVSSAATAGDKIYFDGIEYACTESGSGTNKFAAGTAEAVATSLKTLLEKQYSNMFIVARSGAAITLTQKTNGYGAKPALIVSQADSGTLTASIEETTEGVSPTESTKYTTYVLGKNAFAYCDCGVKKPYEMARDPQKNGGEDTLYARQRKLFAPFGISFTKAVMATASPTSSELENGANWELVNDGSAGEKSYINHKAIPIARIISLG